MCRKREKEQRERREKREQKIERRERERRRREKKPTSSSRESGLFLSRSVSTPPAGPLRCLSLRRT